MTSIPVNNSVKGVTTESRTQKKAGNKDAGSGFSDIFKNQKNDNDTVGFSASSVKAGSETKNTGLSKRQAKIQDAAGKTTDATTKDIDREVDRAAQKMLKDAAEELSVTEEELLSVLQSLSLTPADLLTQSGLQQVVLAVSGENDFSDFLTDESMFTTLQNLTGDLKDTLSELADSLGIAKEDVQSFLTEFLEKTGNMPAVQTEELSGNEVLSEETDADDTVTAGTDISEPETLTAEKTASETVIRSKDAGKQADREASGEEKNFTGDRALDSFTQNLKAGQTQNAQASSELTPHFDVDTENIIRQITDYMRGRVTDGVSEMDMQLHPANLGSVHIHLEAKEGVLTAQFTAQNESVKAALESQMIQLQDSFKEQGITVESIEVMVSSHKFEQSYEGAESNTGDADSRSGRQRTRRVSLHVSMDEEDLSEEEILTKEVLKGQGSTVEFTA